MSESRSRRGWLSAVILLGFAAAACAERAAPAHDEGTQPAHGERDGVAAWDTAAARPDTALLQPGALRTVAALPAFERTGPGGQSFEVSRRTADVIGHLERQIGMRRFGIAMRARGLEQYPCTSCHLSGGRIVTSERTPDAHADIQPVHPAESGATCVTCHVANDVQRLTLRSGETTSLDEAYRICAECHFVQVEAWAGGAHGKRLDGWQGRRIVMGCADCHDPHRPAVEQRIPYPGPHIPRKGHQP